MWKLNKPKPVKLIAGILAANQDALICAAAQLIQTFGPTDFSSDIWPFDQTEYYKDQTGDRIIRQFISFQKLVSPADLAKIKLKTNKIEKSLAKKLKLPLPRPVNLDPGIIEPAKLVLASTKNYSHRIYIGKKIYAEVTLIYDKKQWKPFEHTYPDYRQQRYFDYFEKVRNRLLEQLKSKH